MGAPHKAWKGVGCEVSPPKGKGASTRFVPGPSGNTRRTVTPPGVKRYHGKPKVPVPHSVGGGLLTMIASRGSWSFCLP